MAVIVQFTELAPSDHPRLHPTEVECGWRVDTVPSVGRVLTLETYGSGERAIPGKVSQSIQLTEAAATELRELLQRVFVIE